MTQPDGDQRLVLTAAQLLWSGAGSLHRGARPGGGLEDWHVVPSPQRARLLVPTRPLWARATLARDDSSRSGRARRHAGRLVLGSPAGPLAPTWRVRVRPDDTSRIETLLAEVTGAPVGVAVRLGTPRPNRKPLVQAFDERGRTTAWTKVAATSSNLVRLRREHEALTLLHSTLTLLEVPRALRVVDRGESAMLVMSALTSGQQPWDWWPVPWGAMQQVATAGGTRAAGVDSLESWESWAQRRATATPAIAERLDHAASSARARFGQVTVTLGCWHGDWTPWNMGYEDSRLQVWDWENFSRSVPLGWDPLHYVAQQWFAERASARDVEQRRRDLLPELALLGAEPSTADATWALYLLEVAHRYAPHPSKAADGGAEHRLHWVLDQLEHLLITPSPVGRTA
jgi:hypothetical protein